MASKPIAVEILLQIVADTNKHKNVSEDWTEGSVYDIIGRQAFAKAMRLIQSNLFYYLNQGGYKYNKADVLELAKQVPELAQYIKDHNRSYSSVKQFTEEDLKGL